MQPRNIIQKRQRIVSLLAAGNSRAYVRSLLGMGSEEFNRQVAAIRKSQPEKARAFLPARGTAWSPVKISGMKRLISASKGMITRGMPFKRKKKPALSKSKRIAISIELAKDPGQSDARIARFLGISKKTVGEFRRPREIPVQPEGAQPFNVAKLEEISRGLRLNLFEEAVLFGMAAEMDGAEIARRTGFTRANVSHVKLLLAPRVREFLKGK